MKQQIKNLGMFMRLAVEGGITIIQAEAAAYESKPKVHYDGIGGDLVTSADLKAQAHYQNQVLEHFPEFPVVGEEDQIQKTISGKRFTCDPLDGTKAFDRKQSTGTATMFAFADGDTVPAVCIGDTNTREIYQYAPDLDPVRTRFGFTTFLSTEWLRPLEKQYVLLRHPLDTFPKNIQKMVRAERGGIFKDMEVTSGSIGITVARLWKQEVATVILEASFETPWDTTPLIGMNRELGIECIAVNPTTGEAQVTEMQPPTTVYKRNTVLIMTHKTYTKQIIDWLNKHL